MWICFTDMRNQDTGFPTKDETSETTVQSLYCLFSYIHDSCKCKLFSVFVKLLNTPF